MSGNSTTGDVKGAAAASGLAAGLFGINQNWLFLLLLIATLAVAATVIGVRIYKHKTLKNK